VARSALVAEELFGQRFAELHQRIIAFELMRAANCKLVGNWRILEADVLGWRSSRPLQARDDHNYQPWPRRNRLRRGPQAGLPRRDRNHHENDPSGRCLEGDRLRSKAPFGRWKTQTFISGLRCDALTENYVLDPARPTLERGDTVIMDNLPAHKNPVAENGIPRKACVHFVSAALRPRSQSDRDGLRKTQGSSARQGRPHHRRPLESIGQTYDLSWPRLDLTDGGAS